MSNEFRVLKDSINKGGFNYRKVERYDPPAGAVTDKGHPVKSIAIYGVYNSADENEKLKGYEVFKIKVMKGGGIAGNLIPPGEKYPGNEDIGRWGRAFHGINFEERAWNYYDKLKKEIDESSIKS